MLFRLTFFFSSRRRHTRLQGDWSSDVCSSDLWLRRGWRRISPTDPAIPAFARSEERRVGKECSSRWWRNQSEKKSGWYGWRQRVEHVVRMGGGTAGGCPGQTLWSSPAGRQGYG